MAQPQPPTGVLLVGSIPLDSARDVFTKVSKDLPQRLAAIPDGETGERDNYVAWQISRFPSMALREDLGGTPLPKSATPNLRPDSWKPTDYDTAALASYKDFLDLKQQGKVPSNVRFQICLPSPYNCIVGHIKPELQAELEPIFEQRFFESCAEIAQKINHEDVIIQWDLCCEVIALEMEEGRYPDQWPKDRWGPYFSSVKEGIMERVVRCCQQFPSTFKQAFHLCYGDLGHKHFLQPLDMGLMVDFANEITKRVGKTHSIEWVHMPVPKDRSDQGYFAPLKQLSLQGSQLYLGLVHPNDEAGTVEKIKAAQSAYPLSFGVASECGLGRVTRDELDSILSISRAVTAPI